MSEEKQIEEKLPAEVRANMLSNEQSIFFNVALFEQAQRVATMFANSTMVPDHFKNNVGNCMIGLNYAARLQADPFMVLQCLYVVHGRPGIEGKLVEAAINASGKYSEPLDYAWLDPEDKPVERYTVLNHKDFGEFGCQAFSIDAKSGKRVDGPKITWKLIKAEGWYDKKGMDGTINSNKWRTMPEMMFYYRAASWFGNKNCPELKLGMHTVEELKDIIDVTESVKQKSADKLISLKESIKDYENRLNVDVKEAKDPNGIYPTDAQRGVSVEDTTFRAEFINLRSAGFSTWVYKNLKRIKAASTEITEELLAKWGKFYKDEKPPWWPESKDSPIVNGPTGEIMPSQEELDQRTENKTQFYYLSEMDLLRKELGDTNYFRVLMTYKDSEGNNLNFKDKNSVPAEHRDGVLSAMSSERDAQDSS